MVVEIERGRKAGEIIGQYESAMRETTKQVQLLSDKIEITKQKFEETQKQMESERVMAQEIEKERLKEIEQLRKPRWSSLFGSFGAGIVSALVLVILL